MDDCDGQYVAWFDCVAATSTCTDEASGKAYGPPETACTSEAAALRACCSEDRCEG